MGEDAAAGVVRFLSARVSAGGVLWYFSFLFFSFCPPARDDNFRLPPILLPPLLLYYYNAAVKRDEKPQKERRFLEFPRGYGYGTMRFISPYTAEADRKERPKPRRMCPRNFQKLTATKDPRSERSIFMTSSAYFFFFFKVSFSSRGYNDTGDREESSAVIS